MRLHCAEMLASRDNPEDLTRAIALVKSIPAEDPLAGKANRLVERWAEQILQLGETSFQAGELERALAIVREVPVTSAAYSQVQERTEQWQSVWQKAEEIYQDSQKQLERKEWTGTFGTARQLLSVGNRYWETVKYQELMQRLESAQAEQRSQTARSKPKDKPNEDLFARWQQEQRLSDANRVARARALAKSGSLADLRAAINEADQVLYGTPQYEQAQQLATAWRQQVETMEDQEYLKRATELAAQGDAASLQAAIDEASQILYGRALYDEARSRVERWSEQRRQLEAQVQMRELRALPASDRYPLPPSPQPVVSPVP